MKPVLSGRWKTFLTELDVQLPAPVELHCLGGFVLAVCYGLPRPTGDVDYIAAVPSRMALEVLPENVLARTPDMIAWWSRARQRVMFFGGGTEEAQKLSGRMYPHPTLVFKISGRELFVRVLASDARPSAEIRLKTAPYWNTDGPMGHVCLGSMRVPDDVTAESISGWEQAYFDSEFTHPTGAVRLTSHPGGFVGLWSSLAGRCSSFPIEFLTDAKQTLRQLLQSGEKE